MDEFILHPVTITKVQICEQVKCRGSVNRDQVTIRGVAHEAGSLVLAGFVGKHKGGATYEGHYRLRLVQPRDTENDYYSFGQLPGWSGATPAKEAAHVDSEM